MPLANEIVNAPQYPTDVDDIVGYCGVCVLMWRLREVATNE